MKQSLIEPRVYEESYRRWLDELEYWQRERAAFKRRFDECGSLVPLTADEKKMLFGLFCPPEEDTARQEFKAETDTHTILARYGAGMSFGMPPSGVVDYTMDFRILADAQAEAREAFGRIPFKYRRGYATWREFADAIERGEVDPPPRQAPGGGSPGAAGGAPSDSAAGGPPKGGQEEPKGS